MTRANNYRYRIVGCNAIGQEIKVVISNTERDIEKAIDCLPARNPVIKSVKVYEWKTGKYELINEE